MGPANYELGGERLDEARRLNPSLSPSSCER